MAAVAERETLEQVLQGFDWQKLRLQMFIRDWIQEQDVLLEHATATCLERNARSDSAQIHATSCRENPWQTSEITMWPLHNAADQNLQNPFRQKSEMGDFRQPAEDVAVERGQVNLSANISRKDGCTSNEVTHAKHSSRAEASQTSEESVNFDDPRSSEVHADESRSPGLRSLSQSFDPSSTNLDFIETQRDIHSAIGLNEKKRSFTPVHSLASSYKAMSKILKSDKPTASTARATTGASSLSSVTRIVTSSKFDLLVAAIIFVNSIVMGISADYAMNHLHGPNNDVLEILEFFFSLLYAAEVCLRIVGYGRIFFTGILWKWNLFDLLLVVLIGLDRVQSAIGAEDKVAEVHKLSILRMLRLFKMLRLLRMFKLMMFFRELRLLLAGLLGSVWSMFWAGLLILLISYMVAVGLVEGCVEYLEDGRVDIGTERDIGEYWYSVGRSMISLFMCTTGGEDWATLAASLEEVGTFFYALLLVYMAFFMLALMNTITSLFVDSIMETSSRDQQMKIHMELERRHQYIQMLQTVFKRIDENGDGIVSYAEFLRHSDDPVLEAFASSLDLDMTSSKLFFQILSNNGLKEVDAEAFVVGCIKLKGKARNMDLMHLIHTTKDAVARQDAFANEVLRQIGKLQAAMSNMGGKQNPKVSSRAPACAADMMTSLGTQDPGFKLIVSC